jgi:DNA adenine methylase/adenine-specific DNA-methyltransferase
MNYILQPLPGKQYPNFISTTYRDVYFTDSENRSYDIIVTNLRDIEDEHKAAIGYFALFQTCIIKRPYNLFHRKNLYLRTADVARSFGNKSTWDKPVEHWFRKFVHEANCAVFDNFRRNKAYNLDAMEVPGRFDLIYIDPPYMNSRGVSVDYREFYHFLEGLTDYDKWGSKIDYSRKHLPLRKTPNPWLNKSEVLSAFDRLFRKHCDSILAISYRSDGIPPISSLKTILKKYKKRVNEFRFGKYQYVLSANKKSEETLIVGY